jgi:allophanate hydrolase subunit 1
LAARFWLPDSIKKPVRLPSWHQGRHWMLVWLGLFRPGQVLLQRMQFHLHLPRRSV